MLIILSIIVLALTSQPAPATAPQQTAIVPTLSSLPTAARPIASQRARYVYRLPDNSIWDSFYYLEFRKVLSEFDGLPKGTPIPASVAAWGFASTHRGPATPPLRPAPLWHTLQPPPENSHLTPFIYINTAAQSSKSRSTEPVLKIGKESEPGVFAFTFTEYPGKQDAFVNLPCSVSLGYATGSVRLPPTLRPASDGSLTGEFFLIRDDSATNQPKSDSPRQIRKLIHAQDLRLSPDQYAGELLARRAELVQWSFKRTTARLGDSYTWTRTPLEIPAPPPPPPNP